MKALFCLITGKDKMKAQAIIQARFMSTRLPGKVLLEVNNKTILEYVIERVKKASGVEDVIVATSVEKEDDKIFNLVSDLNVKVYRGSEEDVLDRFYGAAKFFNLKHIIRITADCPLIDPEIINEVINLYFQENADYCSNTIEETFPDGEDVEVFSFAALEEAWENARLMSEREHVTTYIRNRADRLKVVSYKNNRDLSSRRWTLDQKEDFIVIKSILENLYEKKSDFCMEDILEFLKENPALENIN